MNRVIVLDEEKNTIIELENGSIKGCSFYHDGRLEPVHYDFLEIFNSFILSNNYTKLPNEGEFSVYLDNNSGFKHYYLNDQEDYLMFFNNNGEEVTETKAEYIGKHAGPMTEKTVYREKAFKIGKKLVRSTLIGILSLTLVVSSINLGLEIGNKVKGRESRTFPIIEVLFGTQDFTPDELVERIRSSKNLSDEDQLFLANRDFLQDILPYINSSKFAKATLDKRFKDIRIETYDNTGMKSSGCYNSGYPNILYIAERYTIDAYYDDIISHEFIHMCQIYCEYNVISESCAEILSGEYFENSPQNSYTEEIYLIKKMMEIIGSEPIMRYMFAQDFSGIEEGIKPYLSKNEYQIFLSNLKRPNVDDSKYNEEEVNEKHESLNYLLDLVYERKFGKASSTDVAIAQLKNPTLVRYYFNSRKIQLEESYFMLEEEKKDLTLEEAMNDNLVCIYQRDESGGKHTISYQEYYLNLYDTKLGIQFGILTDDNVSLYMGSDGIIHAKISKANNKLRAIIPSVEEKLRDLESKGKSH